MLSGIDVEGGLDFLSQHRRGWDMYRGPSNPRILHHHPFESYRPVMDNVPGYGILPPGQQPWTSSAIQNYPPPHIPTISLIHNNILSVVTAYVRGAGSASESAIENRSGRGNMIGNFLQTIHYLTRITLRRDRHPPYTPMGF